MEDIERSVTVMEDKTQEIEKKVETFEKSEPSTETVKTTNEKIENKVVETHEKSSESSNPEQPVQTNPEQQQQPVPPPPPTENQLEPLTQSLQSLKIEPIEEQPQQPPQQKKTGIMYDDCMLLHEEVGHPERPERLTAIMKKLKQQGIYDRCIVVPPRDVTEQEILAIHEKQLLDEVLSSKQTEDIIHFGSGDTFANKYTSKAAHVAAGGLIELTKGVLTGELDNGFAFIRPPGHHAEKDKVMGFCLFNNVAIAAKYAQSQFGVKKVLILDWDVHHGNGTQHIFEQDPDVLYFSVHKGGNFYPGTGRVTEVGIGNGIGKTVNVPFLFSNMHDGDYYRCFKHIFVPIAKEFEPELVIVSAGFDCAAGDQLGPMKVSTKGFEMMLSMLLPLANGKVVCALEGGYSLEPSANAAAGCMRVLLGEPASTVTTTPSFRGLTDIKNAMLVQKNHWTCQQQEIESEEWKQLVEEVEKLPRDETPEDNCCVQ